MSSRQAAAHIADTIVALASPPGRGARAVVRLSGPRAHELVASVFDSRGDESRGFARAEGQIVVEGWPRVEASLWCFRAPASYTGEDAAELHLPGSPPLVAALVRALCACGARGAAPGEFTRRAFLSGRLDLAQVEAVLALTSAETASDLRVAARALSGGLREAIDRVKQSVLGVLAHVEAAIDFPEEDLPGLDPAPILARRASDILRDLERLGRRSLARDTAREHPVVALAGAANAGKSTLLNALAGREAAIASPVAGTTRDPVFAEAHLGGGRIARLADTAGEKPSADDLERSALERTRALVASADLVVHVVDASLETASAAQGRLAKGEAPATLLVGNKADLIARDRPEGFACVVSARTGEGLDQLKRAIADALDRALGTATDLVHTERQARLVAMASDAIGRARALLDSGDPARFELAAVDLRAALDALGELTGVVATDDLLGKIFGEFCVGK